jgi:spore germination protein PF
MQMPSFIGAFKVVSNTGTVNNGDSLIIAPTISIKTYEGAGSALIGDFPTSISFISLTLVNDSDIVDSGSNKVGAVI